MYDERELTFHHQLVCTSDQCQPVVVIERLTNVLTEGVSSRFCSTACQNRTKVAAFRRRRGQATS